MVRDWFKNNYRVIIFYLMLALLIFAVGLMPTDYDYDLWAKLILGKYFFQTGQVLKNDFYSYTPTHTWYDHEWGSGVIFYSIQHYISPFGLVILQDILIFIMFILIIQIIKMRGVKTTHPYNFAFYFFSVFGLLQMFLQFIRCQLFSFFFFTVFLYILELARKGKNKPLLLLPFLMIIWNNLHGGCVAGLGLIFIYLIGEVINKKSVRKYLLAFLLSCIVLPINPWGIEYLIYLIKATTMSRPSIAEWMKLLDPIYKYTFLEFKYFLVGMLFAEIGYIIYAVKKKEFVFDATKFIAVIVTVYLAFIHIKMIPFAAITMMAFFYDDFYTIFNFVTRDAIKKIAPVKDIIVYIAVFVFAVITIRKADFKPFVTFSKFPIFEIEFIKINNLKGRLLTNFEFGSYVGYKLYPDNLVYMDGRYEAVYDDYIKEIMDAYISGNDKNNILMNNFPPDLILFPKIYPIYSQLLKDPEWSLVCYDYNFGLFVRTKDVKKDYKRPSEDINYYKKIIFDTNLNFKDKEWLKR